MASGLAALSAGCAAVSTRPPREELIRQAMAAPGGKVVSRFYSTWRLEADGRWRIVFDNGYDLCDCAGKASAQG